MVNANELAYRYIVWQKAHLYGIQSTHIITDACKLKVEKPIKEVLGRAGGIKKWGFILLLKNIFCIFADAFTG